MEVITKVSPKNSRAMVAAAHLILSIMFAVNESEWPFRDIRELIHRFKCHSAYLDIGSNVGVQVRKLYEPQLYAGKDPMLERLARKWDVYNEPTAEERAAGIAKGAEFWNITSPVLPIFDKHFGKAPRCGVCAIAVEPNPRHTARHKELQAVLQAAGAGALWLSRTAASTSNGQLDITTQDDPDNGVGFSVRQGRRLTSWLGSLFNRPKSTSTGSVSIRSIDLAELIHFVHAELNQSQMRAHRSESEKLHRHLPHASRIVMKIDTEGAEYVLLPHLLSRGALCAANLIFLEWHPTTQANGRRSPTPEQQRVMQISTGSIQQCPNTALSNIDDETFVMDGMRLPEARSLCNSSGSSRDAS